MTNKFKTLAIAAAFITGASGMAMAQTYSCPAGYMYSGGMCQPAQAGYAPGGYAPGTYAPSNPVSGALSGGQQGMAQGEASGGLVGGIVGGAIGTATGTIAGTANAVAGGPMMANPQVAPVPGACPAGYMLYNGSCYPAR